LEREYGPSLEGDDKLGSAFAKLPVSLQWCPVATAASWRARLYEEILFEEEEDDSKTPFPARFFNVQQLTYEDERLWKLLNKNVPYFWDITACSDLGGQGCNNIPSQLWGVIPSDTLLVTPFNLRPHNGAVVNKLDKLSWLGDAFTQRYLLWVEKEPRGTGPFGVARYYPFANEFPVDFLFGWENDRSYKWKVAPCWGTLTDTIGLTEAEIEDEIKKICETTETGEVSWSEERRFKTTGERPANFGIKEEGKDLATNVVSIPLLLDWDDMPGAASYYYEVATDSGFSTPLAEKRILSNSNVSPGYPQIESNTFYWVRVKTCADKLGKTCGEWANINFTTADLTSKQLSSPKQNQEQPLASIVISSNTIFGANFYNYKMTYLTASDKETAACKARAGEEQSDTVQESSTTIRATCTGEYQVQTRACVDKECNDAGSWSASVKFQVITPPGPTFGLIPCGADRNFTNTPTDDRDPCGIEHIFLLLRNIIDFALWKITLIIVVLMAAVTGATLFFKQNFFIQASTPRSSGCHRTPL